MEELFNIHTTFGVAYIGITVSTLYESIYFSAVDPGLQANESHFAVASSASFRCNVTPTTTGTLWIDRSTRYWYALDHPDQGSSSH